MLDFEYTNDDIASLRKQMIPRQAAPGLLVNASSSPGMSRGICWGISNKHLTIDTRSQPSNGLSPASSILSDPSPTSPRAPKKRRLSSSSSLSDAEENDDDDDEQPLASQVAAPSGSRNHRSGKSAKGGKNNPAMKKKAHIAPTSLAPPVGEEQALMNRKINGINGHEAKIKVEDKLDESQLKRLAAGVPVDAARETGVCLNSASLHVSDVVLGPRQDGENSHN